MRSSLRSVILLVIVLCVIGLTFWLWAPTIDVWTQQIIAQAHARPWLSAALLVALLASDIVLPIPSSLASVACGLALGFWNGALASLLGMTLSTLFGYAMGYAAARSARRIMGDHDVAVVAQLYQRYGVWVLLALRPVPMLAEASILFAGFVRHPARSALGIATLGNVVVSLVYAALGCWGKMSDSFILAFLAAMGVSAVLLLVIRRVEKRHVS